MGDFLKDVVKKKKERLAAAMNVLPEEQLKDTMPKLPPVRPFISAIRKPKTITLIAEIKKQSPSAGMIRQDYSCSGLAGAYQDAGVSAISVITEEDFFGAGPSCLLEARQASDLPLLRKDFVIDPYQVYEARALGADALLLIAELLSRDSLAEMLKIADSLGMQCLVEAHSEKELKKVLGLKVFADQSGEEAGRQRKEIDFCVGINTRDLRTLEVDLKTTEKLFPLIPRERTVVVESGIRTYQDVLFLKVLGVNSVLVGETILRQADVKEAILDLMGW